MPVHDEIFDDPDALDPADSESDEDDFEYIAPVAGRLLGEQHVPRFDIEKLRPFEAVFVDNKDFECTVRGGASTALIFIDYKTRTKHKIDLHTKVNNGLAFRKIVAREGIHKLPYSCRVYSDGCGSMNHVASMASMLGIDHQFIPPHQQSLNEAEKVADSTWADARAAMIHHKAPDAWFSLMIDLAMYTDIRTSTTANRNWQTPYEMTRGVPPSITKMHRPCTRCFVQVPKTKRRQLAAQGLHNLRAEPGRFIGFHGPYSSTYAVILDKQHKNQRDRLVHSINVTFDDNDYIIGAPTRDQHPTAPAAYDMVPQPGAQSEEAQDNVSELDRIPEAQQPMQQQMMQQQMQQPFVSIAPLPALIPNQSQNPLYNQPSTVLSPTPDRDEYFDPNDPDSQPWFTHAGSPQQRARPNDGHFHGMCATYIARKHAICNMVMSDSLDTDTTHAQWIQCMHILTTLKPRYSTYTEMAHMLAVHSQKDMDWNLALKGPDADKAITALENELTSLTSTILTEIDENDSEYTQAVDLATPGRLLLSTKRSGSYKGRGVKQGFKEDTEQADGPNFNYYAHVAKFNSIRMSIFRMNRGTRRIALKDVSTAFLQSDKYPEGTKKYVCFKHPVTKRWIYYKQSGPLYGEKSASRRWEDTIAPWYESEGFTRGMNEPCAFLNEVRDILVLLWTDDNYIDAEEDEVKFTDEKLDGRFDCTGLEILMPSTEIDYVGMQMFQTIKFTGLCLEKYIEKTLLILGLADSSKTARTPICQPIDTESALLTGDFLRLYPTAIGCFGWMANTCRPDLAYAHSRMAQHLSSPTASAWEAVVHCCNYLRATKDLCIAAPLYQQDIDPRRPIIPDTELGWEFYSDSDFAGNTEVQNKRRSQSGFIAMLNGAPVLWGSKVSSVCFAHPDVGEAHADISSGAAEVYAAGNATFEFLHLSYTADEMGIPFPKPFTMQVDNKAAIAFSDNSAFKSKLKHIDVRQEWVQTLRNKSILTTKYVRSEDNLADLFTKILTADIFEKLRNRMMFKRSSI
jgi:hypothetical protein